MPPFLARVKTDAFGYLAIAVLISVIVGAHLLSLCVIFLFFHLFTDVFVNGINRRVSAIPRMALFWAFHVIIVALMVFLCVRVVPVVLRDLPGYCGQLVAGIERVLEIISRRYGVEIDINSVKMFFKTEGPRSAGHFLSMFTSIWKTAIFIVFAFVLNMLLFLEQGRIKAVFTSDRETLLVYLSRFLGRRIAAFYWYFRKVMGGQVVISAINSAITLVLLIALGLPHKVVLISIVFLCGLLPVVGNLVSNTILSITALVSVGTLAFVICLALLVGIHKLEYFLNSKIIGSIIRLPMFITLASLLLGEALLGVLGMIIAIPVALTLRDELAGIAVAPSSGNPSKKP